MFILGLHEIAKMTILVMFIYDTTTFLIIYYLWCECWPHFASTK
jgi:hypothetical protein